MNPITEILFRLALFESLALLILGSACFAVADVSTPPMITAMTP